MVKINKIDTALARCTKKERRFRLLKSEVKVRHYYQFHRKKKDYKSVL